MENVLHFDFELMHQLEQISQSADWVRTRTNVPSCVYKNPIARSSDERLLLAEDPDGKLCNDSRFHHDNSQISNLSLPIFRTEGFISLKLVKS